MMHATINININTNSSPARNSTRTSLLSIPSFPASPPDSSANTSSKTTCNSMMSMSVSGTQLHPSLSWKSHSGTWSQTEPSRTIVRSTECLYSRYPPYCYNFYFVIIRVIYKEEYRKKSISLFNWVLTIRNRRSLPFPTLLNSYKMV